MGTPIRLLCAAVLAAVAPLAAAQTTATVDTHVSTLDATAAVHGQAQVAARIAASFGSLAGSDEDTLALVYALRDGAAVTLGATTGAGTAGAAGTLGTGGAIGTGDATGATGAAGAIGAGPGGATGGAMIEPPTGRMGWGNVFISLALAKAALANVGITEPAAAQLQAALTGGDAILADGSTMTLRGVLTMRAEGMGWGKIAQAQGTKLDAVVGAIRSQRTRLASLSSDSATAPRATGASQRLAGAATRSGWGW